MATHDYVIDNSTGANVRADINLVLQAILTNNSSSSAPSTTAAYMWWADTTSGTLKIRNSANNDWVELLQLDGTLTLEDGTNSAPALAFRDDLDTGIYSSAADTFNVATGGVERMELGATTIFNESGADVDFRIEGDTEANLFYLDAGNDRIIIGHSSSRAVGGNTSRIFEIESTDASSGLSIIRNSANDSPAIISLGKSRSASNGGTTVVQNGDLLGQIHFAGADGTDLVTQGAAINATVDGTAGSNDMPCRLTFLTTADGAASPTERLRIDSSGTVYVGGVGSGATAGTLFFNDTSANGSKIQQVNGSSALSFHTGSSQPERMRIDSSGDANHTILSVIETSGTRRGQIELGDNQNVDTGGIGDIHFVGHYQNSGHKDMACIKAQGAGSTSGQRGAVLIFETKADGTAAIAERMRINSSGQVGINTTSPQAKLNIVDTSNDGAISQLLKLGNNSSDSGTGAGLQLGAGSGNAGQSVLLSGFYDGTGTSFTIQTCNTFNSSQSEKLRVTNDGKVGINTTSPSSTLDVSGSLSKSSGSFKIDHPLPEKTNTHHLVHSFVEAPQANNIYRGKVDLVDGSATVNVDTVSGMTDGTFVLLNTDVQCFTSNETGWTSVKGSVSGNTLTITAEDNTCTDTISWMVVGERHDQHMYDTEWTDENGKVIVEPLKSV